MKNSMFETVTLNTKTKIYLFNEQTHAQHIFHSLLLLKQYCMGLHVKWKFQSSRYYLK